MSDIVVEIKALTRRFGAFTAVDALTLSVNAGEVFGLLGSNGAGKTTTIKMLTTLLPPSSGEARVAGFSVTTQAVGVRRAIGYVPQAVSVDGSLTGYENLLIFAKLYDLPHREQQARIREALEFMGLTADGGRLVGQYSGGMVRRLEIAQSTLHRPRVLFLDEPTVGLDPIARDAVWEHLVDLRTNYGTTLFFTTHYLEEAESHCDRMAIMHLGKVAALGTCQELEASLGVGHTLNDVFVHYADTALDSGGTFRSVSTERATAQRLGYLPAAAAYYLRIANRGAVGRQIVDWQHDLEQKWAAVRFGEMKVETRGDQHVFDVQVYLDDLDPKAVRVELYADAVNGGSPVRQEMKRVRQLAGASGGCVYSAAVSVARPPADYTARVMPHCDGVAVSLEDARILWQR